MTSHKKLILIDGSSYLYRAYYALPPLTTSKGQPTGAVHGVLSMINKLSNEHSTKYFAIVFDAPGKTFRDELYEHYKSNRPPMPDELSVQIKPILDVIKAMGVPLIQIKGVEADDVIGTVCNKNSKAGIDILISTGDKDMAQLVNEKITLVNTMTGKILDREGVKEKFDVYPEQIIDYLALVGDNSDNIPGVPKVGPKTAAKWLKEHSSLDIIISHANTFEGKVGESLRENQDQLLLSKELATIRQDVELPLEFEDLELKTPDIQKLKELYQTLELKTLYRKLVETSHPPENSIKTNQKRKINYSVIYEESDFEELVKKISDSKLLAIDTETTNIDYMKAELVGISFAIKSGKPIYLPLAHDYPDAPNQLNINFVLKKLKPLLENPEIKKIGHHLKYDAHIFARYDIQLSGMKYDSMLESYILNSTATRHNMDSVARHYLKIETIHYEDIAGKGVKQLSFNQISLDKAAPYAAEDADITLNLHKKLWKEINKYPDAKNLYENIEQPLVKVLFDIEETGVLIDKNMLLKQSKKLQIEISELEKIAHKLAGCQFNLSSPKQLQEILFDQLKLPVVRKTPKGKPSTAEDVLQELANKYELPKVILQYRTLSKLKTTYTDKLPGQIIESTGRIHTSYHQAITATGRLSSSSPNLQNIPIRTKEGRQIRKAFIAPKNHLILAADYSQIELRIMAHLSADKLLVNAFQKGLDIHKATAAEIFKVADNEVTDNQRRSAKAINFGLMYGMSAFGLAKQLGISRHEAQEYVNRYFKRYTGVEAYMNNIRDRARKLGFVETIFGRRLYLPEINNRNAHRRQYAERSAINAPMQGTAADIIKIAMISMHNWLSSNNIPAKIIMQVHDELVLEVAATSIDIVHEKIDHLMSSAALLDVPLVVDVGVGKNWDEAH